MPKDFSFSVLVFVAVGRFFIFSTWFSIFLKNAGSFSVLIYDVVFGFSHFVLFGFRFPFDLSSS